MWLEISKKIHCASCTSVLTKTLITKACCKFHKIHLNEHPGFQRISTLGIHDWEKKIEQFVEVVSKHKDNYNLDHIGNMNEVPIYFDIPSKFTIDFQGSSVPQ